MEIMSLILASTLIAVPVYISRKEELGLGKDIIISVIRAVIQLGIVGYILEFVFSKENPIFTISLVLIMCINAAINTKGKGEKIENVFNTSLFALVVGTGITLVVLVLSGSLQFTPDEIIPVAGMIITNAMIAIGLTYRNLNTNFKLRREEVEVKLSLGSGIKNASKEIIRDSIKMAMIPSIDSAKTLGIVSLPGMMTGLILGGASPIEAIKYQIMVTFMTISSVSIVVMICTYMSYRSFFNLRKQLKN